MRVGIALGGGGIKGAAHIGVLRVLESARISLDVITGTSAGAIVGALYAAGKSPDEIMRVLRGSSLWQWFKRDRSGMGLFSTDGIRQVLRAELGDAQFQDLKRTFACVTVDLESRQEVMFTDGLVADAVCASAAFPGLYAPVQIGGRYFVDGGVLNTVPFDAARRLGAARVIAVDLGEGESFYGFDAGADAHGQGLWRLYRSVTQQKIWRVANRSIHIMQEKLREHKLRASPPDLIIYPQVARIGLMDFDKIDVCERAGESAARDALPQVEKILARGLWTQIVSRWRR